MTPLRIAHRGGAGHGPENTQVTIGRALAMGADAIEIDVHATADHHLVVMHDSQLDRTTDGRGAVSAHSLAELRALHTREESQPIPTLDEVLRQVNGRAGVMLELKAFGLAQRVTEVVRSSGFRGPLFYASFLHTELLTIRSLQPEAATIALFDAVPVRPTSLLEDAQATHAGIAIDCLHSAFVAALHERGYLVFTYTANKRQAIAHANFCHVDGIISDFIDRL